MLPLARKLNCLTARPFRRVTMRFHRLIPLALLCSVFAPELVRSADAEPRCRIKKGPELRMLERAASVRELRPKEQRRLARLQAQLLKAKRRCRRTRIIDPTIPPSPIPPPPIATPEAACQVPDQKYKAITRLSEVTDPQGIYFLCNDAQGRFDVSEFEGEFNGGGHTVTVKAQSTGSPVAAGLVEVVRRNGLLHNFHMADSIVHSSGFSGLVAGVSAGTIEVLSVTRSNACSPAGYAGVVALRFGGSVNVHGTSELSTDCN